MTSVGTMHTCIANLKTKCIRGRPSGFTLIEVMIVLVIMGIIAAVAYPSYSSHVRKTRRSDAMVSLMNMAQSLERCRTVNNAYDHANCTIDSSSAEGYFDIDTAETTTATTFKLRATANTKGKQNLDSDCKYFYIDQTGARTAANSGGSASNCWGS